MLDSVGFGAQTTDVTWGRLPNGTGPFRQLVPTYNAQNQQLAPLATTAATAASQVALYPTPADAVATISGAEGTEVVLYNALGQTMLRQRLTAGGTVLPTAILPVGIYYVQAGQGGRHKLVVLH